MAIQLSARVCFCTRTGGEFNFAPARLLQSFGHSFRKRLERAREAVSGTEEHIGCNLSSSRGTYAVTEQRGSMQLVSSQRTDLLAVSALQLFCPSLHMPHSDLPERSSIAEQYQYNKLGIQATQGIILRMLIMPEAHGELHFSVCQICSTRSLRLLRHAVRRPRIR